MRPGPNILVLDRKVGAGEAIGRCRRERNNSLIRQVALNEILLEQLNEWRGCILVRIVVGIQVGGAHSAVVQTALDYPSDFDRYH